MNSVMATLVGLLAVAATRGSEQSPPGPPATPYGRPITLEMAKRVMAAAEAEVARNHWTQVIVIVDSTGHIVMLERFDDTQYGSIAAAEDKARSAVDFKRPTKVFEDLVAQGGVGLRTLGLHGASPLEGGIPIIRDGQIIGAIGVSGGSSAQDGQVARAGAEAK
jgi:glc operon protein GlcG